MRAKEIAKSLGKCIQMEELFELIPLLQEIEVAGANGRVRFLTGRFYTNEQLNSLIVRLTSSRSRTPKFCPLYRKS